MKRTIKWQLLLSFVSLSFILVGTFSWITLNLMESHFEDYVRERQESELTAYQTELENFYQKTGTWADAPPTIQNIGRDALQKGIILKVYDHAGNQVWGPLPQRKKSQKIGFKPTS